MSRQYRSTPPLWRTRFDNNRGTSTSYKFRHSARKNQSFEALYASFVHRISTPRSYRLCSCSTLFEISDADEHGDATLQALSPLQMQATRPSNMQLYRHKVSPCVICKGCSSLVDLLLYYGSNKTTKPRETKSVHTACTIQNDCIAGSRTDWLAWGSTKRGVINRVRVCLQEKKLIIRTLYK